MSTLDVEIVVVVIRYEGKIRWFRCDRDLWLLDVNKWRNEFIKHGYDVPEFKNSYRFGIHIVNQDTVQQFLSCISEFELHKDELSIELAKRYTTASSWWDVSDLFPIMFVNFDVRKVGAFYFEGTPMERYIPDDWTGEFIDFANDYPEEVFPKEEKFWIKGHSDLLQLLNERGVDNS
ncbi:group-specific protein [Candidatus Thiomargarita nelsonii]|uniref:Group-specific protein n=1 Tax=Candidatus Thiomargarita nelsonii TaxID=1003181 RepID=A0A0A6PIM9_9GAMM|nr:group-specific protein [Candidatus Thiomargarita nelsonii]